MSWEMASEIQSLSVERLIAKWVWLAEGASSTNGAWLADGTECAIPRDTPVH